MAGSASKTEQEPESKGLVVFSIVRESKCAECGDELWTGQMLTMETGQPLCLCCADLDHLVFLQAGNVALTRRAKKHSELSAEVVRFSRSRGRYERQGLLVEAAALEQAEEECLEDADRRAERRDREEIRRQGQDRELTEQMAGRIRELFPGAPQKETDAIARHATERSSGRVGRTAAGKSLAADAVTAAVLAAIRHRHTPYDRLLMNGSGRLDARDQVRDKVAAVLQKWRGR